LSGTKQKAASTSARRDDEVDAGDLNVIQVNEYMSVAELARLMDHKPAEVVAKLMELGMLARSISVSIWITIEMVAGEFGFDVKCRPEVGEEVS